MARIDRSRPKWMRIPLDTLLRLIGKHSLKRPFGGKSSRRTIAGGQGSDVASGFTLGCVFWGWVLGGGLGWLRRPVHSRSEPRWGCRGGILDPYIETRARPASDFKSLADLLWIYNYPWMP
jgi:hypothetical protein